MRLGKKKFHHGLDNVKHRIARIQLVATWPVITLQIRLGLYGRRIFSKVYSKSWEYSREKKEHYLERN